jgi:hypothetical protein
MTTTLETLEKYTCNKCETTIETEKIPMSIVGLMFCGHCGNWMRKVGA